MRIAQIGDRVRVGYSRRLPGLTGVRRSRENKCEFMVGSRDTFSTLSLGVVGMALGDRRQLSVPPAEAYGTVEARLIRHIPRAQLPERLIIYVGKRLRGIHKLARRSRRVTVVEIGADSVTVDGNHPLAGRVIALDVRLLAITSQNKTQAPSEFDIGGEG